MSKLSLWKTICLVCIFSAVGVIASSAQSFKTLLSFDGTDGGGPTAPLVQGFDGNLYGTAQGGGASGDGTVFKITPGGALTTLHSFDLTDGASPGGGPVLATNGIFYGTTLSGGASSNCSGGCGTVFKITPGGNLTTLHSFDSADGSYADAALLQATDGNFYGVTELGGAGKCTGGCGTVFKVNPAGTLTTLHSFDGTDGVGPNGALVHRTISSLCYWRSSFETVEVAADGQLGILWSPR